MWSRLKATGVQVVFHLNNAVQPHDALWEHLLIARAIENSLFVVSANNAAAPQALASFIVSPRGRVLTKTRLQTHEAITADLDLAEVIPNLGERTDY